MNGEPTYACELRGHLIEEKAPVDGRIAWWCTWCGAAGDSLEEVSA